MAMRLLIVDATGYLFRAFHAVIGMQTSKGRPTGAVFGLINMLRKLREVKPAERAVCVMDAPGKTFRHEIFPEYKAHRPPMDPALREQIEPAKDFIRAMGWPLICKKGVEADDVIATLAMQGKAAGMEVVIASSDKDLMQFVGGPVTMFAPGMRRGEGDRTYDEKAVYEKFSVLPGQMADYLALTGDSSDNIPGVKTVGEKTAAKWLAEHGSLADITAAAANISGVVGKNLRDAVSSGSLALSQQLVAVKTDVQIEESAESCLPRQVDGSRWLELCEEFEFREFRKIAEGLPALPKSSARAEIKALSKIDELKQAVEKARSAGLVALDTETDGAPVMRASLVGFSLASDERTAYYVPLNHCKDGGQRAAGQMPVKKAMDVLRPLLEDESVAKVFHNGKYDLHVFAQCGLRVRGVIDDTKIVAMLARPGQPSSMAALAEAVLGAKKLSYKDLVDGKSVKNFSELEISKASDYAAEDAETAFKLREPLLGGLTKATRQLYEDIERPLMPVLQSMERYGVRIDSAALNKFDIELQGRMKNLEEQAHKEAGGPFNLSSPKQLGEILFDKMGAPSSRKTTGGKMRSTDERALGNLAEDYELARIALEHRVLAKLSNTYADKLPRMVNPDTGRVHTDFNQTAVTTGRLSSRDPNLQNIPVRTEDGRRIRRAFVAADGCELVSADYSQIELRIMAHFAGDEALLDAFAAGADVHRRTAAEIFGVSEDSVDSSQRRAAKAINFGLIYGMQSYGLGQSLGISQEDAKKYIDRYFARYPNVLAFMEDIRRRADEDKYVETLWGRRMPVAEGNKQAAARAAINAPMQGTAADIIKKAMLATAEWLEKKKMKTRMILQVHDELVFESPRAEVDAMHEGLEGVMCGVCDLKAPLEISVGNGPDWDSAR